MESKSGKVLWLNIHFRKQTAQKNNKGEGQHSNETKFYLGADSLVTGCKKKICFQRISENQYRDKLIYPS